MNIVHPKSIIDKKTMKEKKQNKTNTDEDRNVY